MSKKYKGRTCTYCHRERSSTGPDHVIAREFFLPQDRANLPQVPSCDRCNREKADLEHYLTTLLPFGGRHEAALENLQDMVPDRLRRNQRLNREFREGEGRTWATEDSGLIVPMMTLPVDTGRLLELFRMVTRGLVWHHWQVRLTEEHDVTPLTLTGAGEEIFDRQFGLNAAARVDRNLGRGTFQYEGAQGVDSPQVTIWRFSMYGGIRFGDPSVPGEVATRIGVMTGPRSIKEKADLAVQSSGV